jgi:hypothetical protein
MATMEFTTKVGCSLACKFCPQDKIVKNYRRDTDRMLSFEKFKLVVDKIPPNVRLDFSGMTEPWLNPAATQMVVHAFEQGRSVAIYTTLQGLSPDDARYLIDCFADRIAPGAPWVIHLPDNENNMIGWKPTKAYLDTLAVFAKLKRDHNPRALSFMTMSATGVVSKELLSVFDSRLAKFIGWSRAENLTRSDFSPGQLVREVVHARPVMCASTPFFDHNAMMPNGDVSLCCMDYSLSNVIGNLFEQSYDDLFCSEKMNEIRLRAMKPGVDSDFICKNCNNAVCLDQDAASLHWNLEKSVLWSPANEKANRLTVRRALKGAARRIAKRFSSTSKRT